MIRDRIRRRYGGERNSGRDREEVWKGERG